MANNETNYVSVIGPSEKIQAFIREGLTPDRKINFDRIVPQPSNIERGNCSGTHEPGVICWYTWNRNNWGTKWNAYDDQTTEESVYEAFDGETLGRFNIIFTTAWSAPTPIFEAIEHRWGVEVHALTIDEGGFPDVIYGDPFGLGLLARSIYFQ